MLSLPVWGGVAPISLNEQTLTFILVFRVKVMETAGPSSSQHASPGLYLELPSSPIRKWLNINVETGYIDQQVKKPQGAFLADYQKDFLGVKIHCLSVLFGFFVVVVFCGFFSLLQSSMQPLHLLPSSPWVTNEKF